MVSRGMGEGSRVRHGDRLTSIERGGQVVITIRSIINISDIAERKEMHACCRQCRAIPWMKPIGASPVDKRRTAMIANIRVIGNDQFRKAIVIAVGR